MNISAQLMKDTGKDPVCPYCKETAVLKDANTVYGSQGGILIQGSSGYGNLWLCSNYPACNSYVGVHRNYPWKNYPLGSMADDILRSGRKLAHSQFDLLWKLNLMSRKEAYLWLQNKTGKSAAQAHIAEMDFEECMDVYNIAKQFVELSFIC